ncbi:MAG: nucleoside-diphosphate kinase [Planctomycetaceae bacterium]
MALERTLVLIKPDAVQRRLTGHILARLEDKGLKIVGLKQIRITPELSKRHYAEHVEKPFYPALEEFITSGPVVAICAEGPEAVAVVRTLMGPTNGRQAPPGTIRGDLGLSRQMNLIHGSDGPDAAKREIELYFKAEELFVADDAIGSWLFASDEG